MSHILALAFILVAPLFAAPPNLLVIMADDLGYADMSFLPQSPPDVNTPGIDTLAATGTYFSNAYSTSPICSPSRAGFITGRYQARWGNYWYGQGGLPTTEFTLPQALKPHGYFCHKIGKTHLNGGSAQHPLDHGFDEFLGFIHHTWDYIRLSHKDVAAYKAHTKKTGILNVGPLTRGRAEAASYDDGFTTEIFTEEAVKTIRKRSAERKPFYIQLEHNAVHMPTYITHPEYARKAGYEQPEWDRDAESWEFPFWDPRKMPWEKWHKTWGHMGAVDPLGRKRYLANLMALDDSVSRLLKTLEETGQRDNTIIVFLSDNGGTINTYVNNTPLSGYKYMFGEGGIRIPIIVSWPKGRVGQGVTRQDLVSSMDIFPTVMEFIGGDTPKSLDGKSLVSLLRGDGGAGHEQLCWAKGRDDTWVIRQGRWKLIKTSGWVHSNFLLDEKNMASPGPGIALPAGLHLYNLDSDVGETRDLAATNPERVESMTKAYSAWRAQMGNPVRGKKK
jgi:arylsulfatase A-like enzyme